MNPVAMEPVGAMDGGANGPPEGNADAANSAEAPKPVLTYCLAVDEKGTYSVQIEHEAAGESAEGEGASADQAEGGEAAEGNESLGDGLSLAESLQKIMQAEKSRLSGGSQEQGNMDAGFQGQGGGAVHG